MATLTTLIAAALVRLGLQVSRDRGWYPSSYYVKLALEALRADDLPRAVAELGRAWRDEPGEETQVAREVILMRLDAEAERIASREAVARKLGQTAAGEITVLELRLRRLRFAYRPRLLWIATGAGALILVSTLIAVVRWGLHPGVAAGGLALFAAVSVILIAADRRRQRAAFAAYRAAASAEVAAEIDILRQEIAARETEIERAAADSQRIAELRRRLPDAAPAQDQDRRHPRPRQR